MQTEQFQVDLAPSLMILSSLYHRTTARGGQNSSSQRLAGERLDPKIKRAGKKKKIINKIIIKAKIISQPKIN